MRSSMALALLARQELDAEQAQAAQQSKAGPAPQGLSIPVIESQDLDAKLGSPLGAAKLIMPDPAAASELMPATSFEPQQEAGPRTPETELAVNLYMPSPDVIHRSRSKQGLAPGLQLSGSASGAAGISQTGMDADLIREASPQMSTSDIPDSPSALALGAARLVDGMDDLEPPPGAGQDDQAFVTARMERSKHIANELAKLQEESRRLQEQSKMLQQRAMQMQREVGIVPQGVVAGGRAPMAIGAAQQHVAAAQAAVSLAAAAAKTAGSATALAVAGLPSSMSGGATPPAAEGPPGRPPSNQLEAYYNSNPAAAGPQSGTPPRAGINWSIPQQGGKGRGPALGPMAAPMGSQSSLPSPNRLSKLPRLNSSSSTAEPPLPKWSGTSCALNWCFVCATLAPVMEYRMHCTLAVVFIMPSSLCTCIR